jgi:hypothetical protein
VETTETNGILDVDAAVQMITEPENDSQADTQEMVAEEEQPVENEIEEFEDDSEDDSATDEDQTDDEEEADDDDDIDEEEDVDSDDEDTEDDADQESPELITVKVDGEEMKVTLDDLKQSYSGQKYVQKGMQEAAAQKKEAENAYTALINERQQVAQLYDMMLNGNFAAPPTPPSEELLDTDPVGYMRQKNDYEKQVVQFNAQMEQIQKVSAQQSEAQQAAMQAYVEQEMKTLAEVIPEFGDAKKAPQFKAKLAQGGIDKYGYTQEEIAQITDHRAVRVLNDALKYHEIMAGKNSAEKKVRRAKKVMKPGAKKVDNSNAKRKSRQVNKLAKTGRIEDSLDLILDPTLK